MSKEIENQELINKLRSLVGDELIDQLLDYDNYTAKDQRLNKTEVCRKVGIGTPFVADQRPRTLLEHARGRLYQDRKSVV